MIGEHVNFGLTEFKIFYWSIKRVEFYFFVSRQLYGRKFLKIIEIEIFRKWKAKKKWNQKMKNELIKIN